MSAERRLASRPAQRGLTFIELVFFIVIVTFGLAGILTVLDVSSSRSADPMVRKQMLAVAESVMEEVRAQAFTWCDPDDPNASAATSAANCTGGAGGNNDQLAIAPTPGETRGHATTPWDHVRDYNGAILNTSLTGRPFPLGCTATIQVLPQALGAVPAGAALLIRVTVARAGETLVLEGYRTRYAPEVLP